MNKSPYPNDSLKMLQDIELDILTVIDKICRENDIDYFIESGTLLGAVRHGGFIPWDDDIDLGMPKADYERFLELAPKLLPDGYSLHTSANSKGFSALWAKVYKNGTRFIDDNSLEAQCEQGIFVDIFPYYQLDKDERIAKKQRRKARFAQMKSYLKHFSRPKLPEGIPARPLVKGACSLVHRTIASNWKQDKLQSDFDHAFDSDNQADLWVCAAYVNCGTYENAIIFPTKEIDFAGHVFRGPQNPETFLKTTYGDFLQLPPEHERYTHAPLILDFGDGTNVIEEAK